MVEILLDPDKKISFYAPNLLRVEIQRYQQKLSSSSKLEPHKLEEASTKIMDNISFISEDIISENAWQEAFKLVGHIDENDTPFIALALDLQCRLWTGDKKLTKGLGDATEFIVNTTQLRP